MGLLDNIGENQLLNMGLGILSNNTGNYGAFGPAVGKGALQGIQATQQAMQLAQMRKLAELQMKKAELEMQQEKKKQEEEAAFKAEITNAWTPPSPIANMSFMDANKQVMAGQEPGYQITETPGKFDFNKAMPAMLKYSPKTAIDLYQSMNKSEEPYSLSEGQTRWVGGKKIAENPKSKDEKKTQLEMMLDAAGITDPKQRANFIMKGINKEINFAPPIQVLNYPQPMPAIGPDGKPTLVQFPNKPGEVPRPTGYSPLPPEAKAPTEQEAKAAFYVQNMRAASQVLDNLEASGFDPTNIGSQVGTSLAGGVTNPIAGKMEQQARQAQNQWAEQMLRMQTGAAATTDEIKRTIATYFPSPGDSPEVVAQKRDMRQQAEGGVLAASGRASGRVEAAPKPTSKTKIFKLDGGGSVTGYLGKDGKYYTKDGKHRIEE